MSPAIITKNTLTPWLEKIEAELTKLGRCEIHVGILSGEDGDILKIARVHEFGATITAKNAQNLAIPLKPSVRGKSPREISNTWILDNGENRFIVRNKGKDEIDFLFLLVPKVTIPERSFIRAGYDNNQDKIAKVIEDAIKDVMTGKITAEQAAEGIGLNAQALIQEYMGKVQPLKSPITLASAPGKTTPLLMTGRLRKAITYRVEWK